MALAGRGHRRLRPRATDRSCRSQIDSPSWRRWAGLMIATAAPGRGSGAHWRLVSGCRYPPQGMGSLMRGLTKLPSSQSPASESIAKRAAGLAIHNPRATMRGAWFAARHRRRLWQAATIARAARDQRIRSEARNAARSARRAKLRFQRTRRVSLLLDRQTVAAVSEMFEHVAATLQAVEEQRQTRRRRGRMRRIALGATVIGGAAFGAWRYGRPQSTASPDTASR